MPQALAVLVTTALLLPSLLLAASMNAAAHNGTHGTETDPGFWNVVEGWSTKTGFRLLFFWDADAPVAGIVSWGYSEDAMTNVARPLADVVDTAQMAIVDIPRSAVVPGARVHFKVTDVITGSESPVKSFRVGNAWTSSAADGVYEVNAILQLDSEALPDSLPWDQGVRNLADGVKILSERIWDATDGYVRIGRVLVTDTNLNYPANFPGAIPVGLQGAPGPLGGRGFCVGDDPQSVEGVETQNTLADFLVMTSMPFDSHTWRAAIDDPCTPFWIGRAGQLIIPWEDDLHLGSTMAHEFGHYALDLDDLYPVEDFTSGRGCKVGINGPPDNAAGQYDISLMHNQGGWSGSRWTQTELDRLSTPCNREGGDPSWPALAARYPAIPATGRLGNDMPDHGDSDYTKPRGNPNGGALDIFILDNTPGASKVEHYVKGTPVNDDPVDPDGVPEITIASPAAGATVPPATVNVAGSVDREASATNAAPTATLTASPTSGTEPLEVTFNLEASDSDGTVVSWSFSPGDGAAATTGTGGPSPTLTHTYTVPGDHVATLTVTDNEGATGTATRTIKVGAPAGRSLIGTDPAGDTVTGSCNGTTACDPAWIAGAKDGLDLKAAYIEPAGENIRFTIEVVDAADFFVDPSGDPATGASHIVAYQIEIPFQTSPGTQYTASISRDRGATEITGSLGKFFGAAGVGLTSSAAIPDSAKVNFAANRFTLDIPKSSFTELALLSTFSGLNATASILQEGTGNVRLTSPIDEGLESVPNPTYTVQASASPAGFGLNPSATLAPPSSPPANPQVTDPQGDNFGGSAVTHSDIVSAWFENDDEYLYVGLEVADIPADPTTTAQIGYEVLFKPTWTSDWEGVVGEFTGLGVSAVLSAVHFNLNTLGTGTVAPTNGTHRFELVVHSTDGATDNFNILGEIPLSSADADSDIFWFVVPRTMLQNPAPGATLTELGAVSQAAVGGLLTWSTVGDTATSGASYALKGTTGPLTADAGGPYPGAAGAPVSLAGTATGGAEPYACAWSGAGATFANANACATTATYAAEGTYEVTLTVTDDAGTVATDTASVGIGASNSERVEVYVDGETVPRGIVPVTTSATNPVASWNVNVDLSGLTGAHTLTARWYDAAGTLLDSDAVQVSVTPTGAPVVEITTPEDASTQSGVIAVEGTAGHGAAATLADGRLAFDPDSLFMARAASETRSGHIFAFCSGCQGSPLTGADLGTSTAWLFGASSPFNGADGVWLDVAGLVGSEFVLTAEFNSPADVWFFNSDLDTQDLATGNVVGGQMPKTGTVPPGTNWAFVYLRRPTQQNAADLVAFDDTVTLTLSAPRSVPSAPQALTASPGATSITLSWQAPASDGGSPITGYKVYRDQNAPVTVPATQTSYVDTGLAPLTRYSYNVTAVNAIGESLRAGPVSARTTSTGPDTEAPSAVTDLAVTGTTATTVSLAWNASTDNVGVARYNVHRGSSADFTPTAANRVGAPEGTTFTESGLAPGGTYHYKVAAVDDAGNVGPASAPVAATTPATGAGELVTLTVDGAFHAALVPENGVWATTLDTRTLAPGTHTLTATYDDGLGGSDTDSVTIVVDNPQETPGLAIVSPAEGADVAAPVTFAGTYDLPGDDGPAPVRGMRLDDALPDPTEAWLADPFVQSVLKAPSYKTLVQTFSSSPGFGGAVPMPTADGAGKILVLFRGEKPVNAETLWQGAWNLQFLEHQVPQVLRQEAARAATPISLEAFEAMMANAQGPPTPGIQAGVGPGTAMQQGFGASTYICTASYLFENPATGKYYLGTAGHCLLDETSMSSVSNPAGRANYIDLCYADCISNMVGLGQYVRLAPNPATGYHPVAFAQQWDGTPDNDVGTDFGLIEIPASVYQYLRPYMWVWGGPDSYARPLNGDVLTHYGHGAYYAATPASQARLHVGLFTSAAREVAFLGVIWGGDSGSALGIGEVGGDGLFYGAAATGTLTHGLGIQEPLLGTGFGVPLLLASGTDLQRGLDMAEPHLGFRPVLVTGGATIREPGDPTATPLKATITSPAEDAVFDGNTVTSVTVQGTATFPAGSGPGTGSRTYYMHRTLCGAGGILFMDETKLATEAGDGCGNFAHPVGPALSALGAPLSSVFPANPKPGTDIAVDRTRPITASFYLTPYIGDGLIPPAVVYDYEFRLTAGGVLIGSERITSSPVATAVDPWANFSFMALEDTIPAGSDLTATFIVHHAVGPVFMAHGGDLSPTVAIPLGAASTQAVEVSVDDPTFAPGSLLPVTGTTAWSATWPLASVADGEHTLYARALKNGVPQTGAATVNVTVTRTEDVPPTAAFTADATGRLVAFTDASTPGSTPITAWSWSFGDGNTASTQNAAHRYTADGTYTATLTVTDANGLTATASAPVTVLANAWELQVRIVDAASTVHVPWTAVKEMADGEDGQWTYTWDPAARPAEGAYTLEARILQNGVPVATATRTVNHLPNTAPELDAVGAKTVNENATLAFTLTATDADGDALTYEATGLPAGATLSPAGAFAWTPDFTQAGDHLVTFRVTDGDLSDSEEVTLTVVNVNQAPVIAPIPNQAVLESATLQVAVDASDPDGDALTLSASGLPAGATFDAETRTLTWTPEFGRAGTYPGITVSATDGALSATRTFTITVLDVNRGPVLGPLTDANVTEASLLAFTVTGADPDGDTLTYSAANLPAGAGFNGTSGQFSWTPTYDQAGVYENVTFSVTDGNTTDAASIRIVVVNLNRAPVPAAVPDQSGAERGTIAFTLSAADADNDTLAFNADALPQGATLNAATGAFQWTPGYEAAGFYQLGFAVSDGEARVPVTVNLTVTDTPAPIVNKATGKGYDTLGEATAAATAGETILVRPGTYNEAVTLAKPGLTLCRAGPNSTDCDDTAGEARISGGTRPAVVITASDVTVKGFTLTIHGSAVQVTGTATNPVRGVVLEGNTLPLPGDATSAAHGIRLLHTRDVVLRNNTIRASITPGSQAIGIERSVAPVISGNTIHGGNVAITLVESTGATVTGNTLVGAPANALGAETTALHAHLGGGHVFSDNAVTGASYGLLVVGASNVAVDGGTFTETATGIVLRNLGATQPHGFRVNNATLPDTANKLVLDTGTRNLNVDARYNYWGAFTRTSITAASIRDRGVGNVVNVDCFIDRDGVNAICPPTVAFATSAPRPAAPVQFTEGTKSGGRDVLTWSWSFGDGATSTERNPVHTYPAMGTYPVTLTVTDAEGYQASRTEQVAVTSLAPIIGNLQDVTIGEGQSLTIPVTATDPEGDRVTLAAAKTPAGASFSATGASGTLAWTPAYHQAGEHLVTLTATDEHGARAERTFRVTVANVALAPEARPDVPAHAMPGKDLTLADRSVDPDGGRIVAWRWDLGQGATSTERAPIVRFASEGLHTVSLTVTDDEGDTATATRTLLVDGTAPEAEAALEGVNEDGFAKDTVRITLGGTDAASGLKSMVYRLDGANPVTVPAGTVLAVDAAGAHEIEYWAVDNAGNLAPAKALSFIVDNAGPTASIVSPGKASLSGRVTFTADAVDEASGIERVTFYLDGTKIASFNAKDSLTHTRSVGTGIHTFRVVAVDRVGHVTETEREFAVAWIL